jgi:hypothetical protein
VEQKVTKETKYEESVAPRHGAILSFSFPLRFLRYLLFKLPRFMNRMVSPGANGDCMAGNGSGEQKPTKETKGADGSRGPGISCDVLHGFDLQPADVLARRHGVGASTLPAGRPRGDHLTS